MDQARSRTFQLAFDQIKRYRSTIIVVIVLTMVATVLEVLAQGYLPLSTDSITVDETTQSPLVLRMEMNKD